MQDYKEYLATHVLNDSETVNYRMLSRALKIHSHRAKQCLFDFHSRQAQKKPDSIYATYLIAGRRKGSGHTNGTHSQQTDDVPMPSSPVPSSSMPEQSQEAEEAPSWARVVLLAKDADLDNAKASLDQIDSIHIYSLSPGAPSDLQTLGECARRVIVDYATEDPLEKWAQYGVIQNPNVWRRTRKGQPVPPPAVTVSEPVAKKATAEAVKKEEPSSSIEDKKPSTAAKPTDTKPPPTLKRDRSSIMSSFARTQAPKKPAAAAAPEPDPEPALSDEDADPDDPDLDDSMALDAAPSQQQPAGKSKREREEELRKMMEADSDPDETMPDAPAPADEAEAEDDDPVSSAVDTPTVTQESQPQAASQEQQQQQSQPGRRRGRRRVMKKRTVKDEEGYLVTKEEAVWESFSEDEESQPAKKVKPAASSTTAKKPATAAGNATQTAPKSQAGIMSFFAKR